MSIQQRFCRLMYFYLSYPFIGFFFLIHITEFWNFSVRLALSLERESNQANSSTEVNGFHSASSFSLNVINALQFTTIELNQSIHRTQCDVILWEILDVDITNANPRPRQNHPCSRRLRGHPQDGRHKRSTRASPSIGFQVRIPPRHRRCPDH